MKLVIVLLATLGCITSARAKAVEVRKMNGSYGTAGCGLGSLAFGNEPGAIQILAATLNSTGGQTFGITTGTSNCGSGLFAKAEINTFIDSNSVALENDIVRGQGETLSTLNNMLGCDASFSGALQKNYKNLYGVDANSSEVSTKIVTMSQSCRG